MGFENDNKHWDGFVTMKRWLENRNKGKTFVDYFHDYGYKKIAIYGAGDMGRLLYEEIKDSDIEVAYFADRNGEGLHQVDDIPVVPLQEIPQMEDVDGMIITPAGNYDAIYKALVKIVPEMRMIYIKDAVYEF